MYLVVDLEATCWEKPKVPDLNEIIDIGIVVCDNEYNVIDTWSSFVKPKTNTSLSSFCRKLTSITQADVDSASYFGEVLPLFVLWMEEKFKSVDSLVWYTWGSWDLKCLTSDCERHSLKFPFGEHRNLKDIYSEIRACSKKDKLSLKEVISRESVYFPYKLHRGLTDAVAAAKVAKILFDSQPLKQGLALLPRVEP